MDSPGFQEKSQQQKKMKKKLWIIINYENVKYLNEIEIYNSYWNFLWK